MERAMGEEIRLDGKVAVVTGGGRGLGRAMALALVEAGANVIAADVIGENLEQVAREAASLSNTGVLEAVTADIRRPAECTQTCIQWCRPAANSPNHLFCKAGFLFLH